MAQLLRAAEVPNASRDWGGSRHGIIIKMVYGATSSLMYVTVPAGYRSEPHMHDTEQLDYMAAGEMWVFIEDSGFLAKAGDFFRVPSNAIHWTWNGSSQPCTIVESHAPGLQNDPKLVNGAMPLLKEGELSAVNGSPYSVPVDPEVCGMAEVEKRVMASHAAVSADGPNAGSGENC